MGIQAKEMKQGIRRVDSPHNLGFRAKFGGLGDESSGFRISLYDP